MRKLIIANLNWLLADRIIRIVGGLFVGIWVARYLGPGEYGLLNFALSFVTLFGVLGKLGMEPVVVRELTTHPEREKVILGSVFRLKVWSSLTAIALVLPAAWIAQPDSTMFILLVAIFAVGIIFNVFDPVDIFYQAKVLSKHVVQARTFAFLVFVAARVGLILGGFSIIWFAWASILELALASGLIFWVYHRKEGGFRGWIWQKTTAKLLLKDGWPLIVSSLLIVIHTRIDQVMIGQMLGEVQVGHYSAAVRISETWLFVPVLVVQTVMPYFVRLREQSPSRYQQRLMQLYSAMFWSGVGVGVMSIIFGREVIAVLFGEAYSDSYSSLVLLIWTGIFIAQAVARGIWMVSENLQVFRLLNNFIAVPINIGLNLLLIPKYGATGAAMASLISIGAGTWLIPLLFKSLRTSTVDLILSINPVYLRLREKK